MDGELVLTAGLLTTLTLEVLKWVIRRFVLKEPEYDFPTIYYELGLPLITALWGIGLAYVGWGEPIAYDWMSLLQWALAVFASLVLYHLGIKPMKAYRKANGK